MPNDKKIITKASVLISILMLFVLAGVLIGTIIFSNMGSEDFLGLSTITNTFISKRAGESFWQIFRNSIFSSAFILLSFMFLGLSSIGQPFVMFLLIFRGIGMGTTISYIYFAYGLKGFFIVFLLILPNAIISTIAIIVGAREALRFGTIITMYVFKGETLCDNKMKNSVFKLYLLKFAVLFAIIIISSLMDAILTALLGNLLL